MSNGWTPTLGSDGGTLHERILAGLRRDIEAGTLAPGARMPTHRELARDLGIGVGTVTKAYAEAERLGLLTSRVGRGTFVAGPRVGRSTPSRGNDVIDLTMNLPPLGPSGGRLAETLARLRRRPDISEYVSLTPHAGLDWHRQAAAEWLARSARFDGLDWRKLLICTGAQQAMALALDEICRPGDVVLTEAATFHGLRALAEYRGYSLIGLPMDREGLLPEALDRTAAASGSRVLYVQPTLQNPTARTMSRTRREDIVRIARGRDLWILEGDIYAPLAWASGHISPTAPSLAPLASLAPERTFYASSVSKALAPGLRTGFLVTPGGARFDRICSAMRASCYSVCALGPLVTAQWIKDGTADEILGEVAREAAGRTALARRILGGALEEPSFPASLHVWLPMTELAAERIAGQVLRQGVALTPPSALLVAREYNAGLRLCLSACPHLPTLDRALRIVASVMATDPEGPSQSVI